MHRLLRAIRMGAEGLVKYPRGKVPIVFRGRIKFCTLTQRERIEVGLSINRCRRIWAWLRVIDWNNLW